MKNYLELGREILEAPQAHQDTRSGKTISRFSETLKFDLREGFPLLTSKFIAFRHLKEEVKWYMMGTDKIDYLIEKKIGIWSEWSDENNSIGPTYGVQWRDFNQEGKPEGDQVQEAIRLIKEDPTNRRIIIDGWNPLQLKDMALPPCLVLMQFHVGDEDTLHMTVHQRSADYCLGVPYDIGEMAIILTLFAKITGKTPATLAMNYGNVHIYENHIETFKKQMESPLRELPQIHYEGELTDIDDYDPSKLKITGYDTDPENKLPRFRFPIAV